jgi:hypothetical protein
MLFLLSNLRFVLSSFCSPYSVATGLALTPPPFFFFFFATN